MSSVRTIAKNIGVSVATVSRALNGKPNVNESTRQAVLAEAERVGYTLRRNDSQSRVLALAYTWEPGRVDYGGFDAALMRGILQGINEHRFDVNILNIFRDKSPDESYTSFFRRKGVSGAILRTSSDTREVCHDIAAEGFPSIVIADRFDEPEVNFIGSESRVESRKAVEHLVHLGHRRIGIGVHQVRDTDHEDRRAGYIDAIKAAGMELDPALIADIVADMDGGANAVTYFLSLPDPPTAFYFTDPLATLGALHRCRALGLQLPRDLSLVGFDDSDVRQHAFPPFTAVCQDAVQLGFESARWLTRLLSGQTSGPLRRLVPTRFEINQTTAAPPNKAPSLDDSRNRG